MTFRLRVHAPENGVGFSDAVSANQLALESPSLVGTTRNRVVQLDLQGVSIAYIHTTKAGSPTTMAHTG